MMAALYLDEGISRQFVIDLRGQGFTVVHALDFGPKGRHDALLFLEAQQQQLTIFTLNREDFLFLTHAWQTWGLGDHHGVIAPKPGQQPSPGRLGTVLEQYCQDVSIFRNRIELF